MIWLIYTLLESATKTRQVGVSSTEYLYSLIPLITKEPNGFIIEKLLSYLRDIFDTVVQYHIDKYGVQKFYKTAG